MSNFPKLLICGVSQKYDSSRGEVGTISIRVDALGRVKSSSLGKFEPANQTETETVLLLDYLKIAIDGTERLEIDKYNFIYSVDGVDYLSAVRNGLGL